MKLTLRCAALLVALSLAQLAGAVTVGQADTFQDGTTQGWFAGGLGLGMFPPLPPHIVPTSGPAGAGDQFLLITSQGGDGPGSRLAAQNLSQWAGKYLNSGPSGIAMDLRNLGGTDLTIRLLFEDPMMAPPVDEAVTTFGAFLPTGGNWTHVVFPISPSSMTVLSGDVRVLLANTTLIRIIDSPTPEDAVPIAGVLGVDNIAAIPEPATLLLVAIALSVLLRLRVRGARC